jgi:hypothetical protein
MKRNKTKLAWVIGLLWVLAAPGALAQNSAGAAEAGSSGQGEQMQATLRTEGGRRVYVATSTIEVRGEIQRPYAFSLSGRSSLGYSYLELPVRFVHEIINAVRRSPF